jgi:glycosyltransferase involved in cell wall biosynthesis
MKILILTSPNPYKTAGVVALDLYNGLKENKGNEVKMVVRLWGQYPDKNIIPLVSLFNHFFQWIVRKNIAVLRRLGITLHKLEKRNLDYSFQDYDQTITCFSSLKILLKAGFTPDVIIILFMQDYLTFENLKELHEITGAPLYLYLMDMAPMTGGCHYAWDCKGYRQNCGNCPALYSKIEVDQSRKNWEFKRKNIINVNLTVIAGTEWQYRQLLQSSMFRENPKRKVLLGIDGNVFKPENQLQARNELNLPKDSRIVFFGAVNVVSRRKGFKELIDSLKILKERTKNLLNIHIVVGGHPNVELEKQIPFEYTMLGRLNHKQLALAFQAADLFLCPSIEDSGPMMINQSVMCGTPVVAFEMGVALDLVHTGETGYLAKLKNSNDLAYGIEYVLTLEEPHYKKMRLKCRETGIKWCDSKDKLKEFTALFSQ